jgi:hypothetical protein
LAEPINCLFIGVLSDTYMPTEAPHPKAASGRRAAGECSVLERGVGGIWTNSLEVSKMKLILVKTIRVSHVL